jgi:hypothetical protein
MSDERQKDYTEKGRENYDAIFGKKKEKKEEEDDGRS